MCACAGFGHGAWIPVIDRIDAAAEETSDRVKGWFRRK
jgi:hypothetical protein